jgi:DNA-binding beta-propeller fold protein YncE
LLHPAAVAVSASGVVYVADPGNNRIAAVDTNGNLTNIAGSGVKGYLDGPGAQAEFDTPAGIALDATGNLFVADTGNNLIRVLTPGGP